MFEHDAGRIVRQNPPDHARGHHSAEIERIVLDYERNVCADRLDRLPIIRDDLVVGAQPARRGNHDARGAGLHRCACEGAHGSEAGRGHTDDHRQRRRPPDKARRDINRLLRVELGGLAQDAEHGQAGAAAAEIKVGQAVDRGGVDPAVEVKWRGRDG
jgi:hypothetical protein